MQGKLQHWLPFSFVLAKCLEKNETHTQFLTIPERKFFQDALVNYATWIAFINQTIQKEVLNEIETACFRVRSMLYEQFIPHVFPVIKHCCHRVSIENLETESRELSMPSKSEIAEAWNLFLETHTPVKKKEPSPQPQTNNNDENNENLAEEQQEENLIQSDNVPLRDIYHSLEFDRAAMVEQRKLEEFEAQEELDEKKEERENTARSLSMFTADGNFNLKYLLQGIIANRQKTSLSDRELQNLLSDFKPNRSKWANDDHLGQEELYEACEKVLTDLKNYTEHSTPFLTKVSKRDAPDYFEVIKKPMDLGTVTKKLKSFVYKSKAEFAADLHLIYDNCLTYNTNPASEFRKHAIAMRKKTERLMSRVPDIAIKEVPHEAEEDEISDEEENDRGHVSKKRAGKHRKSSKQKSSMSMDQHVRERSLTRGSSAAPLSAVENAFGSDAESVLTPDVDTPLAQYGGKHVKKSEEQGESNVDLEQEDKKLDAQIDADLGEFQNQVWRDKTKKTRAKLTTDVENQYQFEFGEREALVRSNLDMERFAMLEHLHDRPESVIKLVRCEFERFLKWTNRRPNNSTVYDDFDLDSSDDENLDAFFSKKITKPNKVMDDSNRNDLFLADYEIVSGLPEIKGVPESVIEPVTSTSLVRKSSIDMNAENLFAERGFSQVSLDVYPELDFPDYGLNPLIDRSNRLLERTRFMYSKCYAIKNNFDMSTLVSSIENDAGLEKKESNAHKQIALKPSSPIPPLTLNNESGHQLLQKTLSKLLIHTGFEGANTGALNVLTNIMADYLTNIGKTMRSYYDTYNKEISGDEMLSHTLYENGIDAFELEDYVRDDVERNIQRLEDLNRKLETSYQEMLSDPGEKNINEEDLLEEEDTFVTGVFGEDIGEDYFGFRNLGLDQEYNLNNLQIPSRLWFGKEKAKLPIKNDSKEQYYKFRPPPAFVPIKSEKSMIGLLQPYFAKRLSDPIRPLIEDEYTNRHKTRSKYPPSNKPTQGRKKLSRDPNGSGLGAGSDLKKKRKRPTEEIVAEKAEKAEKRRLKMEEKAQKIAEKEQKRKLREEEKQARIEAKEKKKLMNKKSKQPKSNNSSQASPRGADEDE